MEEHESSSSGLMIGIIVGGGIVVVLLIAGTITGFGLYTVAEQERVWDEKRVELDRDIAEMEEIVRATTGVKIADPQQHLVGVWDSWGDDGRRATMEFRADGTLLISRFEPGRAEAVDAPVQWSVRNDNDRFKIAMDTGKGEPNEYGVRFLDNDRMIFEITIGKLYHRRKHHELRQPPPPDESKTPAK